MKVTELNHIHAVTESSLSYIAKFIDVFNFRQGLQMYPTQPLIQLYSFNQVQSCGILLSSAGRNEDLSLIHGFNKHKT